MKKLFHIGKVDYNNTGRKMNMVTIKAELKDKKGLPCFSASGNIWNGRKTDIICVGQMIDEILELYPQSKRVQDLHRLWKLYHLNDFKAGTAKQEAAIKEWQAKGNKYDYNAACNYLSSIGLYTDPEANYKYGTGWIYSPIPANDLEEIKALLAD